MYAAILGISKSNIGKDGSIEQFDVITGLNKHFKTELIRVFQKLQTDLKWIPGTKNGEPVRVEFTIPVNFKLE